MIMLTDGKRTFGISMETWDGNHYSPDMAAEFFEVGSLPCDEYGAYIVPDVEYCIEYARDWQDGHGDFAEDTDTKNRTVFVASLEEIQDFKRRLGMLIRNELQEEEVEK